MCSSNQSETEKTDTIFSYIAVNPLIPPTPVLTLLYIVIIEAYLQCFTESVSLRDIGKPTSFAEISSPYSLYHKAVKGAHFGSALTGTTSEITNYNRKKKSRKTHYSLLRKKLRTSLYNFMFILHLKFKKRVTQTQQIVQKIT